jgi:D-beta-D-heptose 7-phosphate kinase/D-beta-D-heptose 1-phosphate adenosyltransferase
MNRTRVEQILNRFPGRNILILGDLMLDEFIWGKVRRISPEAPVPVVDVIEETYRLGGSGNVAANVRALDGNPISVGVVGRDSAGDRVLSLMEELGIDTGGIVRNDRVTTLKTRIIAHHQQVVRADREARQPIGREVVAGLSGAFMKQLPDTAAVIVSDYDKGVVNRDLMAEILPQARSRNVPVFLDPKVHHADYYRPITMITPNQTEAEFLTGLSIRDQHSLEQVGRKLIERFGCEYALITRGEDGMSLFTDSRGAEEPISQHLPTFAREVFDVTGAGDTVIATLALVHAAGAAMAECATLANHAAGIVVGKVGTATVTRSELLSDFVHRNAHSAG